MITCPSVTLPTLPTTIFTIKNSQKPSPKLEGVSAVSGLFPQTGGRVKLSLEPSRTFAGRFRYQRKCPALLRHHPLTAERSCTFAGTIRHQRKRPAFLRQQSAGCGNVLHFCRGIPLVKDASRTFAGD